MAELILCVLAIVGAFAACTWFYLLRTVNRIERDAREGGHGGS